MKRLRTSEKNESEKIAKGNRKLFSRRDSRSVSEDDLLIIKHGFKRYFERRNKLNDVR